MILHWISKTNRPKLEAKEKKKRKTNDRIEGKQNRTNANVMTHKTGKNNEKWTPIHGSGIVGAHWCGALVDKCQAMDERNTKPHHMPNAKQYQQDTPPLSPASSPLPLHHHYEYRTSDSILQLNCCCCWTTVFSRGIFLSSNLVTRFRLAEWYFCIPNSKPSNIWPDMRPFHEMWIIIHWSYS